MPEPKVTADHLKRDAYLYVRQSTLRQVAEHGESTQRQYALRDRAIAAGWPIDRIYVIDRDLGKSGSSSTARDGFQQLVSEVTLGKAGIVMGLEVSRLARNSAHSSGSVVNVSGWPFLPPASVARVALVSAISLAKTATTQAPRRWAVIMTQYA